jgi:putative FmdB family regulatory protein
LPLYAYRCTVCGHSFEKIQNFNAEPELVCPKCGGALERPLTAPAFQFKGAGWYVNDYAPKSSAAAGTTEKKETPADSTSTETKKPAASETSSSPSTPSAPASSSGSSSSTSSAS